MTTENTNTFGVVNFTNEDESAIRQRLLDQGVIDTDTEIVYLNRATFGLADDAPLEDLLEAAKMIVNEANDAGVSVDALSIGKDGTDRMFDIEALINDDENMDGMHAFVVPTDVSEEELMAYLHERYPGYEITVQGVREDVSLAETERLLEDFDGEVHIIESGATSRVIRLADSTADVLSTARLLHDDIDIESAAEDIAELINQVTNGTLSMPEYIRQLALLIGSYIPDMDDLLDPFLASLDELDNADPDEREDMLVEQIIETARQVGKDYGDPSLGDRVQREFDAHKAGTQGRDETADRVGKMIDAVVAGEEASATDLPFRVAAGRKLAFDIFKTFGENLVDTIRWFGYDHIDTPEEMEDGVDDIWIKPYGHGVFGVLHLDELGNLVYHNLHPDFNDMYLKGVELNVGPEVLNAVGHARQDFKNLVREVGPIGTFYTEGITTLA